MKPAAAKAVIDGLKTKKDDGEDISLPDLQRSIQYGWLLDAEDAKLLEEWRQDVVATGPDVMRKAGGKTAAPKAKATDKKKCVQNLFRKL